ncbi:uncharacterized protein PgNI_08913 [Pyricularia grisea]|uniref:Protein YOP1 n=1 Tax=Pyricularia grisea TaxID=148305 RepID=A0A6P8AVR5_PYRGI|nr:uncharacterized protein PgNI_08913 [Pyricularia grisea]TLD06323.1 hypothetical protein PgNI_08913 [Pyricularia grisea]
MFDIFAKLLSSIASFLFPLFASYKALKTTDPAQLTPWLMYWVVLACALLVESWTEWFLCWIPFYAYIRLLFLLYLILPQTQGARVLYQDYIHPYLQENEDHIDDFIASAHDRAKAMGIMYLRQLIEYVKVNVLGMAPSRVEEQQQPQAQGYGGQASSVTQNLLARFTLPSARWSGAGGDSDGNSGAANDFYGMLAGAVGAAMSSAGGTRDNQQGPGVSRSVIPSHVNEADKATFIATQRERLTTLLAALDREAASVQSGASSASTPVPNNSSSQGFFRVRDVVEGLADTAAGLTKSRSETDFENIDAMSGTEEVGGDEDGSLRRRTQAAGGSWMPWGWGGSQSPAAGDPANPDRSNVGQSSGVNTNAGQ